MLSPLQLQPRDLGIRGQPPKSSSDPRTRLAEEDALAALIHMRSSQGNRPPTWLEPVTYQVAPGRGLSIRAMFDGRIHPSVVAIDTSIVLPALTSQQEVVKRNDRLYLVNVVAIVGATQDATLGQVSFLYKDRTNPAQPRLVPTQKENSKRYRAFWLLVLSPNVITPEIFKTNLPKEILAETETARLDGERHLPITSISPDGQQIGSLRIYARDPALVAADYPIVDEFIEVVEVCQVARRQNNTERGFTDGNGGEAPFDVQYTIIPVARPPLRDVGAALQDRMFEVFAGVPGVGTSYARTVQNLTAGLVPGNPGRAGEAAASPNGSPAIGNDARITFTNQAFVENRAAYSVIVQNDGSTSSPVLTVALSGNTPDGTIFSQRPEEHKIYGPNGVEQAALGRFINTGNSITWLGTQNTSIQAGQRAYVVPAVKYPAGSGFSVPFAEVEAVWVNGVPLDVANIRYGEASGPMADLTTYETPAANQTYFAVFGRERGALHYIYEKTVVTSDANGVIVIPTNVNGCFAFVEGFPAASGAINKPVVSCLLHASANPTCASAVSLHSLSRSGSIRPRLAE
jgi:hypothetical protein